MTNDATLDTVRRIEDTLADMDRSMEKDRQGLQNLDIRLQAVETQVEALRKAINQNASKVKDKVQEVVEPMIESTDRLNGTIKKSKKVYIKEEVKSLWKRIFERK